MENNKIERVPIHLKMTLTSKEAAEYSNIKFLHNKPLVRKIMREKRHSRRMPLFQFVT